MITLDPTFVGKMDRTPAEVLKEEAQIEWEVRLIFLNTFLIHYRQIILMKSLFHKKEPVENLLLSVVIYVSKQMLWMKRG